MHFKIAKLLALIIGIEACIVMIGWVFGIDALTRILPNGINMKFITAFTFFLSAIGLYYLNRRKEKNCEQSQVVLPGIALLIFLIMSALLASGLSGGQTGLESFLTHTNNPLTFGSGLPSIPTTINFILFGLVCVFSLFPDNGVYKRLSFFGYVILIIGIIAVIGYILNLPVLYYEFTISTVPMAFNTALTFILLGAGMLFINQAKTQNET